MVDQVFICYSRKDRDFVLKLAKNLKDRGVPIWVDKWDIPPGANWDRAIEKALRECSRMLLVLSPSSVDSDRVQNEWLWAIDKGKKVVVPILYQECDIPIRLSSIQYTDFTERSSDDKETIEQILRVLEKVKGAPAKPLVQNKHEPEKASDYQAKFTEDEIDALGNEIYTKAAEVYYNQGVALCNNRAYDAAIEVLDKAIELNPKMLGAWLYKGLSLLSNNKNDEAIKVLDKAIELDPNLAAAWYNKGVALSKRGQAAKANAAFTKAKKLGYTG